LEDPKKLLIEKGFMSRAKFSENPSNIGQAADGFISALTLSAKSKRQYEDILWLFIESLKGDGSSCVELPSGAYVLSDHWCDIYGGAISGFLDWYLPRKAMLPDDEMKRAPGILRKFIEWSFEQGYFDREHYDDFMESLPKSKSQDIKRLRALEEDLYLLHSPNPGAWARGEIDNVKTLAERRRPEKIEVGYMTFLEGEGERGYFNQEQKKIGPVMLTPKIVSRFKRGDIANLTLGLFEKIWLVLETGNVYPEGTF
jgi:hypothetical protein